MSGMAQAGWYYAEGDPPGTKRWWTGTEWMGDPVVSEEPAAPSSPTAPTAPSASVASHAPPSPTGLPQPIGAAAVSTLGETYADRSPFGWFMLGLKRWKDFDGRSRRAEYWWFTVINIACYVGLLALFIGLLALNTSITSILAALVGLVLLVWWLALLVPGLSVSIRRLHDTGREGVWFLLAFVPVAGLILLIFYFEDTHRQANKFGVPPK